MLMYDDLFELNLETFEWQEKNPMGERPSARSYHSAVIIGRTMWIFGGKDKTMTEFNVERQFDDLFAYDLDKNTWRRLPRPQNAVETETNGYGPIWPEARDSHVAFVSEGKMYIFGGNYLQTHRLAENFYSFDPHNETWSVVADSKLPLRRYPAVGILDKKLLMFGGYPNPTNDAGGRENKLFTLDLHDRWTHVREHFHKNPFKQITDMHGAIPPGSDAHCHGILHGKFYVASGWDQNQSFHNTWEYDPKMQRWDDMAPVLHRRVAAGNTTCSNYLYCLGGFRFDAGKHDCYEVLADVVKFGYPGFPRGLAPPKSDPNGRTMESLYLFWEPPIDENCSPVDCYRLEFRKSGDDSAPYTVCYEGPGRSHTQDGLTPWTSYDWRIRARNVCGWSNCSLSCTDMTLAGPPGPPDIFLKSTGPGELQATWKPTYDNGSPVFRYELQQRPPLPRQTSWIPAYDGPERQKLMTNLENGCERLVRCRCFNQVGPGPWTEVLGKVLGPPGPPIMLCEARGCDILSTSWKPPLLDGGSPVVAYHLQLAEDESKAWEDAATEEGPGFHEVTGLPPITSRSFRARCRNAVGWGPWAEITGKTDAGPPQAPFIACEAAGPTSLDAWWEETETYGLQVLEFQTEIAPARDDTTVLYWSELSRGLAKRGARGGLMPASLQKVRCRCRTVNGWSDWAEAEDTLPGWNVQAMLRCEEFPAKQDRLRVLTEILEEHPELTERYVLERSRDQELWSEVCSGDLSAVQRYQREQINEYYRLTIEGPGGLRVVSDTLDLRLQPVNQRGTSTPTNMQSPTPRTREIANGKISVVDDLKLGFPFNPEQRAMMSPERSVPDMVSVQGEDSPGAQSNLIACLVAELQQERILRVAAEEKAAFAEKQLCSTSGYREQHALRMALSEAQEALRVSQMALDKSVTLLNPEQVSM
jgi:hypothetical protein